MDFLEQVRSSADIADVIGSYMIIKRAGPSRYSGLCPFHKERTPSFSVNTAKQFYHCFGCKASGDVFKFVQEIEGISFWEALKALAERYGIPIPRRDDAAADAETKLRAALYRMHEIAQEQFSANLFSQAGVAARDYLKRRGLDREAATTFGLGYSDPSGQALIRRFQAENFTADQLRASGLVRERESGGWYDMFRGRLMFPIHSERGKIIAFGGRAMSDEEQPKYLNSPDTEIYHKREVLYNLHRAKESIRQNGRAVLVEGYMDVIGVFAGGGVQEVVASCGTAFVDSQARAIKRHCDTIYVNFDPDPAGTKATTERIPLLLREGFKVFVVELEEGLDPDEYVKKHGAERYRERFQHGSKYFHWLADQARRKHGSSAEGRTESLKSLLPALQDVQDAAERLAIADEMADLMGVSPEERVRSGFRKAARDRKADAMNRFETKLPARERELLHALLANPAAREAVLGRLMATNSFKNLTARPILETLARMVEAGAEITFGSLEARLENPQKTLLHELISADEIEDDGGGDTAAISLEQALRCLETLESDDRTQARGEMKARVRAAERAGRFEEALQLMKDLEDMDRGGNR
ncbi:MAG TPA: DNA primase [Bryobacteraceae bacterium]